MYFTRSLIRCDALAPLIFRLRIENGINKPNDILLTRRRVAISSRDRKSYVRKAVREITSANLYSRFVENRTHFRIHYTRHVQNVNYQGVETGSRHHFVHRCT